MNQSAYQLLVEAVFALQCSECTGTGLVYIGSEPEGISQDEWACPICGGTGIGSRLAFDRSEEGRRNEPKCVPATNPRRSNVD